MNKTAAAVVAAANTVVASAMEMLPQGVSERVQFSYTADQVSVTLADSLTRRAKTQALAHVMMAFKAAGWTLKIGRTVAFHAPDAAFTVRKKAAPKKAAAAPTVAPAVAEEAPTLFAAQDVAFSS
ncbi:hypothetical protein OG871_40685 (plasmid) [Kitasatospora sp. NBC_00374]|uniref:hypothetical protein n=1 Tax=Kitasatospora sp. NBC_00374 TaxID=2975964 RepID=UPI002F913342